MAQVRLDVQVVDGKDIVTGLAKDDFVIYDDGDPQPVLYFGREAEPLRLLLLLDISGSMKQHLQQMATTAKQALRHLRPGDRVGIMLFSRDTKVREEFTQDLEEVTREIQSAVWDEDLGSGTAINSSILSAAEYMREYALKAEQDPDPRRREERRAIVIVTDNLSLNYKASDEDVLRALYSTDTVLNAIVVGKGHRPPAPPRDGYTNPDFSPADVFLLSEKTGGEAVKAERADATFLDMMERIRTRYSLNYKAPDAAAGAFRPVRVDLAPAARKRYPQARIHHRLGYYVGQ